MVSVEAGSGEMRSPGSWVREITGPVEKPVQEITGKLPVRFGKPGVCACGMNECYCVFHVM